LPRNISFAFWRDEEKGKGVAVRRGLKEAQSESAGQACSGLDLGNRDWIEGKVDVFNQENDHG